MLMRAVFKKTVFLLSMSGVMLGSAAFAKGADGIARKTLLQQDVTLPSPDVNVQVIKVSFPSGAKTPRHTHEGPGPRYVLKGTLQVVEGDKTGIYSQGEVFWESGQSMTVENIGGEPAELVIFQMGPGH